MTRTPPTTRADYAFFHTLQTRWMDNDGYGHINNVAYYSFFDTAIAIFLDGAEGEHATAAPPATRRLVVSSRCQYLAPASFPVTLSIGVAITALGRSSVHYAVAAFSGDQEAAIAQGEFVHVFTDPDTGRPIALPPALRQRMEGAFRPGHPLS